MLPDVDRVVDRLWQHTGGNPFYALEVARVLAGAGGGVDDADAWEVPVGVRDVLRHRLASLSDRAGEVLPVAAVLGAEVDVELLAQVVRLPEDEVAQVLDEGVAAGLLVESGASWTGRLRLPPRPWCATRCSRTCAACTLRAVHLRAAEALMSRPRRGRGGSAAIAVHLRAAGAAADPGEAARYSLQAAREAGSVYAWDEAIEHAEAAVGLLDGTAAAREHADAAVAAGMLRLKSGRGFPRGAVAARHGPPGVPPRPVTRHRPAWCTAGSAARCALHHSVMDIPGALEHFDAAERLLPTPDTAYHLHRGRSQAAMLGLRTDLLEEASSRAEAIATAIGRRDLAVVAGWARGWAAANEGRLADAAATWERGWRTAHEMADPYLGWMPVNAAALLANAYLLDPRTARSWCRRGLGQPRFTSFAHPHGAVVDQLALALAAMGEVEGAHEAADRLPLDAGARRMLLYLDGSWEEAEASWADAVAADEAAGDLHDAALNLRWLASARVDPGRPRGCADRAGACTGPGLPGPPGAHRARCPGRAWPGSSPSSGRQRPRSTWPGATRSWPAARTGAGSSVRSSWRGRRWRPAAATATPRMPPRPAPSRSSPPIGCRGARPVPWRPGGTSSPAADAGRGRGATGAGTHGVRRHPRRRPVEPCGGVAVSAGPHVFHATSTARRHGGSTHRRK